MKTCEEEIRQFSVVCRIAIQLGWRTYGNRKKQVSLVTLGNDEFGLTPYQTQHSLGQARDTLTEITRLDRIRKAGRVNFPTSSDELVARLQRKAVA